MSFQATPPFPVFFDTNGDPLESGNVYFGIAGLDPSDPASRITVYWDSGLTIPAQQPVRTSGGYLWYNGSPRNVYIPTNYSILVQDKNGGFVYQNRNSGASSLTTGVLTSTVSDLNFDPNSLGMQVNEVRLITTTSLPSNPPDVAGGTFYVLQLARVSSSEYRLTMTQGSVPGNMYIRSYSSGVWSSWAPVGSSHIALTGGSSPYTLTAWTHNTLEINAITNPFILNLPSSATCAGYRVKVINTSALSTGLIKINPFAGDRIGPMPISTSVYLQNVDQSGWLNGKKEVELVSDGTGGWAVEGQWMPEPGSVDSAGSQYYLGKLRHLPLGNTTSRSFTPLFPGSATWSSGYQATGNFGIPIGAKAIRARVLGQVNTDLVQSCSVSLFFSDNTSNTPTRNTSHPSITILTYNPVASLNLYGVTEEIDIPLNSSGQFFQYYVIGGAGAGITVDIQAIGYYMGD